MSPKITINGKEIDTANLPRELQNLEALSPQLKELLSDKDGNGIPDIADNPFAMLGKLGQLSSMAKDMPVLLSNIKTQAKKTSPDAGYSLPASSVSQQARNSSQSQLQKAPPKPSLQNWASASPPIKKDTGRNVIFITVILGLIGWALYQYLIK